MRRHGDERARRQDGRAWTEASARWPGVLPPPPLPWITLFYNVYGSDAINDPVDYGVPLATTQQLTWTSQPEGFPGSWSFGVRAADFHGEERNIDCALTVTLDQFGNDITNRPGPPIGLRAIPKPGAVIQAEWIYFPVQGPKQPTGFYCYATPGPTVDYTTPAATVLYSAGLFNAFIGAAWGRAHARHPLQRRGPGASTASGPTATPTPCRRPRRRPDPVPQWA